MAPPHEESEVVVLVVEASPTDGVPEVPARPSWIDAPQEEWDAKTLPEPL